LEEIGGAVVVLRVYILPTIASADELKWKFFNKSVIPTVFHGSEMWATTEKVRMLPAVAKRNMGRIMEGTTVVGKETNKWFQGKTRVNDLHKSGVTTFRWTVKIFAMKKKGDWR
uniref:Ovule protein n=1 Tax=Toxocara canis TaxID=6265 RepID=A0A183VC10_TOXCA